MKKLIAFAGALCFMAGTAAAYVTDAPHNETNNVLCGNCHTYSLWWQYSPAEQDTTTGYATIADAVCNSCHDNKPGYPSKIGHTVASMLPDGHDPDNPADWSTKCVDCHDPHQQAQLDWATDNATLADQIFLVTGNVVTSTPTGDGNTTILFDPNSIQTNVNGNWLKVDDPAPDTLSWENKNKFSNRGLIFVHDTNDFTNTYSIISTDSTNDEIILRGAPDTPIDDNATFGLIYGQLIKQHIDTPSSGIRAVKFFDPLNTNATGGFVDTHDPREGICQVCHTVTAYWHSDGTIVNPSRSSDTDHNQNLACTNCHDTDLGFKPGYVPHPWLISTSTTCANCHLVDEDGVVTEHDGGNCQVCHTQYPVLVPSISGRSDNGSGSIWPTGGHPLNEGTCYDCHNGNLPGVRDITSDFTSHLKAFDDDNNSSNGVNGHDGQVLGAPTCTDICHFHSGKDLITEVHVGTDLIDRDPCIKCHDLEIRQPGGDGTYDDNNTMITKGSYSGSGAINTGLVSAPADCTDCHTVIAAQWKDHPRQSTHEGQITGAPICTRCHIGDVIDVVHGFNCGLCHDGGNGGAMKSLAATFGPGDCTNCHGLDFYRHDISKFRYYSHEGYGTVSAEPLGSSPDCMLCHNEGDDMVNDIHFPIDLVPPFSESFNVCTICHDSAGFLVGSATGHGLTEPGFGNPNICSTCHVDHVSGHPSHVGSTSMNGFVLPTPRCVSCHTGDTTEVVHNNNCLDCHETLFRQGITDLKAGLPDPATYGDADGHLECVECHQALGSSFFAADFVNEKDHWKKDNHDGQVDASAGCANCHSGTPIEDIHWGSGLCATCHQQNGILQGSASGLGTGKPPVGSTDCMTCHGDFILHNSSSIDPPINLDHDLEITLTPTCDTAGCHTEIDLVNGIHDIQGCSTCHAPDGNLTGSAIPLGGECIECHTTYFDGHDHGTNAHYVSQDSLDISATSLEGDKACNECHTPQGFAGLNWPGIKALHDIGSNGGCATCHNSTRSINVNPIFTNGDVPGVIFDGNSTNMIHCLDCHTNAATFGSTSNTHPQ